VRRAYNPIVARLAGLGLILGAATLALGSFAPISFPWNRMAHYTIVSPDFGQMNGDAGVELNGVRVGQVESIAYGGGQAHVRIAVSPSYAQKLHRDVHATIQPHGLLGPKYVSLAPGAHGRLPDGAVIPASQVTVTTDFDQVVDALQPDVRQNLQTTFVELGNASQGRGGDMNDAIRQLAAASDNVRTTTGVLQGRQAETTEFIDASEQLNSQMQYAPIDANIRDTDKVLVALVAVEDDINGSIDHTAGTLYEIDVAMNGNSQNLAYVLGQAPGTVVRLNQFLDLTNGTVVSVRPHVPNLLTAVVEGERVTGGVDANGHYVRVLALSGPCTAAPDPSGACSSSTPPSQQQQQPSPAPPSAQPAPPSGASGSGLTDAQLAEFMLGGG
jgi:virulence factor Mce-like protein